MGRSGFTHEQIINKLREVEVLLSQGGSVREASKEDWGNRADLLPLEETVRWDAGGASQATEGA